MAGIGAYKMVKLFEYVASIDGNGNNTETKVLRYKLYSDVSDSGGGRSLEHGQLKLSGSKVFKVKAGAGMNIKAGWVVRYLGADYAVTNVERIAEKRFNLRITGNAKH